MVITLTMIIMTDDDCMLLDRQRWPDREREKDREGKTDSRERKRKK